MASALIGPDLNSRPDPPISYEAAVARIGAIVEQEAASSEPIVPEGFSISRLSVGRTETAVVLLHGYTSMPGQFRLIADAYAAGGCNVWVPRMPFHGYANRMTSDLSGLSAELLRDHADRAIDIAAGLGERVLVVGLSGGGSIATWCAAERAEVSAAVAISPLMKPLGIPAPVMPAVVSVVRISPFDIYSWWYPKVKAQMRGYGYPRFSYRGIAALLSLVYWVDAKSRAGEPPIDCRFTLVRNDGDDRLDGAYNEALARRVVAPGELSVFEIPASAGLIHDIVTPERFGENADKIGLAYRYLSEALGIALPDPVEGGAL
jgi:carboxylesterase